MRVQPLAVVVVLVLAAALSFAADDAALARSGGGGGGGSGGGGLLTFILLPFFLIYSAILTWLVVKKNKQSHASLRQLEEVDRSWALDSIKARIEQAFFELQHAWMARDHDKVRAYMSDRLYRKHKLQTDQMLRDRRKNVLERINLKEAKIVEVADYRDDSKDRIWVHIEGSMIDYTIDEDTGEVVSGSKGETEHFEELWKLVRSPDGWVVDEIDQKVGFSDLFGFETISEEVPPS